MSKAHVIWWAITGSLFSLLVGVAGGLLAVVNGSTIAGAVMVGAAAVGGTVMLWFAGTAAIQTWSKPHDPGE
ncbi:hypothetical protein [Nonomuraea rhizosphaerae]|uniref:hypothetical protein n=1 Tax=Nonomuraea rhizosphaerae TaxID=2665663 RepID=UPI001C5FE4EE|nr:hypothetical protein [Nonomuraea rhizosphaerae]